MKTQCSKVVRFFSVLAPLGKTTRRLASQLAMLAAAVFAAPLQAQIVYDAAADFSITNGNPNGAWSYGWMPTDFSLFQTHATAYTNVAPWGYGWASPNGPHIWKNFDNPAYGVPTGWLSLHPGAGQEPSVLRWTSPLLGSARIQGRFLAGDSGTMLVAVRMNGQAVWQAVDSGAFDLLESIVPGVTVDFVVYGGYYSGNTPLEATIKLNPSGGAIFLRQGLYSIAESSATLSVEVFRFGPEHLNEEVTVDYATVEGAARAGEDYVAASGTLHFAAGETNKLITISLLNDALTESEEQFRLVLSNPTGGVSLANTNAVIRIEDNDPGVRFMTENVTVSEAVGVVTVVVERGEHHDLNLPFTVDYATVAGTAHAGEDYVAASGTLQFAAGETNKLITITILDDALREHWEQFRLVLSNPTGGVSLGNSNVVIWIQSNEPTTYYVKVNNPNPMFPYTSWATAATNIQHAVDAARAGDTVLVTNGMYAVGGKTNDMGWVDNRVTITNAIRLESVNGPLVTSIKGERVWNETGGGGYFLGIRCVYLGSNAVLSGFMLTKGMANQGGGVYSEPSGIVTNCVITDNFANGNTFYGGKGGGAYGGTLYDCTLTSNWGNLDQGYMSRPSGVGGAVHSASLYNCTLTGNSAVIGGGAIHCTLYNCTLTGNTAADGGGAYVSTLYNCTVTGNSVGCCSGEGGGGVTGCTLYNCTLSGNSVIGGEQWSFGAGGASASTLYNCTVTGNSGGGASESTLYNSIVTDNDGGSGGFLYGCTVVGNNGGVWGHLFNSIVYYNFGGNYAGGTVLNFSCTTPLPTNGVGNITGHPLFRDMDAGDFRLREESPCIDAGANLIAMNVGYTYEPTDFLGNTRFIDGNFDGTVAWDMGAYEFNSFRPLQFTCAPQRMPDCWRLSIAGAPNKWVHVQRSSDLKNWEDVWFGFMGSTGIKQVDDADLSQKAMFYRAVVE